MWPQGVCLSWYKWRRSWGSKPSHATKKERNPNVRFGFLLVRESFLTGYLLFGGRLAEWRRIPPICWRNGPRLHKGVALALGLNKRRPRGLNRNSAIKRKELRTPDWVTWVLLVAGVGFEPHDLRVMSPTSCQTAPLRDIMVPEAGVEPVREKISRDFKSRASANSAIPACYDHCGLPHCLYIISPKRVKVNPFLKKYKNSTAL